MNTSRTSTDLLESILAHALELRDQGNKDWLEIAVADNPELADAVRDGVRGTSLMPRIFGAPENSEKTLGRTLAGRFRLMERIGAGAMGVVYLAEDLELVRTVAVKILRAGSLDPDLSTRRFLREAEAMASVQHPSVISIHDRGLTDEGEAYIVMEWVDGVTLTEIAAKAPKGPGGPRADGVGWLRRSFDLETAGESSFVRMVVKWTADLASGLELVHASGVLHRDVKPSNVLVRKNGVPVLLDFGLALLDADSTLTRNEAIVGTPAYMPPEALVRGRNHRVESDVYSLTATLYNLLTLRQPYQGTPSEVLAGIATREPVRASRLRPGLPRELQAILDKGMHRRPRARYTSAAALEADLRAFLDYRPIEARPVSAVRLLGRRLGRSRTARGAAMALGLTLLTGLLLALNQSRLARIEQRGFDVASQLPPNLTIVGRSNRVYRYEPDRAHVEALLDEAIELGREPLKMHLMRASFRLDHGDPEGAADDMARVAREVDSPYATAVATRYALCPPDGQGADAIDMTALPPAVTVLDRYLAAYHLLRADEDAAAIEQLADPELRSIPHAEELRLTMRPIGATETKSQFDRALGDYEDTLLLEQRLGGRTAATAYIGGRLLDEMGRYGEALQRLEEGIALADRSHVLRINAGFSAFALQRFDKASEHLEVAIDLRPNYWRPLQNLIWVLIEQGEFDEALRRLSTAPLGETDAVTGWRLVFKASVETHRALALRQEERLDEFEASIMRAADYLLQAEQLGPLSIDADVVILRGLQDDSEEAVFTGLASLLLEDPHNSWVLRDLIQHLPADLSPEATATVRRVLETLKPRRLSR